MATALFFFNDTATTEIYTLSLHDALPIFRGRAFTPQESEELLPVAVVSESTARTAWPGEDPVDRKSTRLNSSHSQISYAVFCLTKNSPGMLLNKMPFICASDTRRCRSHAS